MLTIVAWRGAMLCQIACCVIFGFVAAFRATSSCFGHHSFGQSYGTSASPSKKVHLGSVRSCVSHPPALTVGSKATVAADFLMCSFCRTSHGV
jgi:hypothetical protein